jgi:hypothetical protein
MNQGWVPCPDPLSSTCGWHCSTISGPAGQTLQSIQVGGLSIVRMDYANWLADPSRTGLVDLMVSACDLPAQVNGRAPTCLTLKFCSELATRGEVPDLYWAQTWLDWLAETASADQSLTRPKVLAEIPPADDAFRHRWLSLVRALCDERKLEFSALGQPGHPSAYNNYLAKPRKGCCRFPSQR